MRHTRALAAANGILKSALILQVKTWLLLEATFVLLLQFGLKIAQVLDILHVQSLLGERVKCIVILNVAVWARHAEPVGPWEERRPSRALVANGQQSLSRCVFFAALPSATKGRLLRKGAHRV